MIQPEEIFEAVWDGHSLHGDKFTLDQATRAIESVYSNREKIDDELEPSLVVVAGKFDSENRPRFDIGIYPSFSLFQPIEILFSYPLGLRNWTLKRCDTQILEFTSSNGIKISSMRNSNWFRRYQNVKPIEFVCRMRTADELETVGKAMANAFEDGL